jgi:hypothetical protein
MIKQSLPEHIQKALQEAQKSSTHTHDLPNYIVALRTQGWTLDSIAEPLKLSRERIRQLAAKVDNIEDATASTQKAGLEITRPDKKEPKEKISTAKQRTDPTPHNIQRMLELQPLVQQVRANRTAHRTEAEEYTRLLNFEHEKRGVSLYRMAQELGVTHGALRFRLVRYGYKETNSTSRVYKKVLDKNRVV